MLLLETVQLFQIRIFVAQEFFKELIACLKGRDLALVHGLQVGHFDLGGTQLCEKLCFHALLETERVFTLVGRRMQVC